MLRVSLRARGIVLVLVGSGGLILALLGFGRGVLEPAALERERNQVLEELILAELALGAPEFSAVDPSGLALLLGERIEARVTLIAPDGRVLGDSGVPGGDVRDMANHADRPEFRAALDGRIGVTRRFSATVGAELLYAAVTTEHRGEPVVLRLGHPLTGLERTAADYRRGALGLGAGALVLLLLGGWWVNRSWTRAIGRTERGLHALSEGEFERLPSPDSIPSELEPLAAALARTATEFRGRHEELERERDEVLTLVDSIAEGVIALTGDARILRMNRAARELLEVAEPAAFAPVGTLVRNPGLRDHLEDSVVRRVEADEFEIGGRRLRVSAQPVDGGGAVVTLLDVTELRRMEKIRRDFVANASHELKTPLTSMRGFAETLLEGDPPPELRREFLNSIRKNTLRLQNLVDDLLDLSRLESGAWTIVDEEVEMAAVAREVWAGIRHPDEGAPVHFSVEGDGLGLGDSRAIHQIFQNLFDNALRFTPEGGEISVRIDPSGSMLRVAVSDTGAGVPSAALPRIFERFYRVDAGRDRGAGGTGLGLAIVRHLIQSMGGRVWAESELGQGTTIHFTVPRVPTP